MGRGLGLNTNNIKIKHHNKASDPEAIMKAFIMALNDDNKNTKEVLMFGLCNKIFIYWNELQKLYHDLLIRLEKIIEATCGKEYIYCLQELSYYQGRSGLQDECCVAFKQLKLTVKADKNL